MEICQRTNLQSLARQASQLLGAFLSRLRLQRYAKILKPPRLSSTFFQKNVFLDIKSLFSGITPYYIYCARKIPVWTNDAEQRAVSKLFLTEAHKEAPRILVHPILHLLYNLSPEGLSIY